jgi:hypothetical protein
MFVLVGSKSYQSVDWSSGASFVGVKRVVFGQYGTNIYYPFDGDIALLELTDCVEDAIPAKIATKATEPNTDECPVVTTDEFGHVSGFRRKGEDHVTRFTEQRYVRSRLLGSLRTTSVRFLMALNCLISTPLFLKTLSAKAATVGKAQEVPLSAHSMTTLLFIRFSE